MSKYRTVAFIAIAAACAGCSIRPLPENVTHVKTAPIVHRIRCEMSDAIVEHIAYYARHNKHLDMDEDGARRLTKKQAADLVGPFAGLGVVYAFSLDMTETNVASIGADIIKPIGTIQKGLFSVNPGISNTVARENLRAFTIVDSFETLRTMNPEKCHHDVWPNLQYPIAGSIGLEEELRTFISLAFRENLSKNDDKDLNYTGNVAAPAMADTITFTTTFSAGATPKVTLNQVSNNWQVADAASGLSATQVDKHQVIIGLGLPDGIAGKKVAVATGLTRSPYVTAAAAPGGSGLANALSAVNQQILRYELPRPIF